MSTPANARYAGIRDIAYHLPEYNLTNEILVQEFPEWSVDKIASKTGIHQRRISAKDEFSSDLAVKAATILLERHDKSKIDYLILCTQSPDYYLPTTACILQDRLGLNTAMGAFDFNLGCSGYVYGLGLAKALIENGQASSVLLITAETYSKFINSSDKSVRTLFGDAASATLIEALEAPSALMHSFTYGTDGKGAENLIVPRGGMRPTAPSSKSSPTVRGLESNGFDLYMDGPEIFNFTLRVVPGCIQSTLEKAGKTLEQIDLFVFHQANRYMMDHLRKKLHIPSEKFFIHLEDCGNTVSSTIPIALFHAQQERVLKPNMTVMLVGFGVGYSWAGAILNWV